MEICAACCQCCCECFNSCQDSNLALSCAIFGGPDCNCCTDKCCAGCCSCPRRCYYRCKKGCKNTTEDVKGKYMKIVNAPSVKEMNRTELVF